MPPLFQKTPTGYYVATGRVAQTYDEALRRAQELQQKTGVRLYVSPLSTGGYRLQTGLISSQSEANKLAQQWARYGVKYISPTYTPQTPAQSYDQATQRVLNEIFERVTNPQQNPYQEQFNQIVNQLQQVASSAINNPFTQQLQNLISQIQQRASQPFTYDPQSDPVFQSASRAVQRQVMEAMNERGILNSTITSERAAQTVGELAAQFAQQAWERYNAQTQALQSLLQPILAQAQFIPSFQAETLGSLLSPLAQQAQFTWSFPVESLSNILNALVNQYQYERSFPLAESEVTGRYGGQPTQQAQQNQIAAVLDLLRLLPVIPRGIGSAVPGPLGDILNRLQNTRLTLGNLL